MFNDIRLQREFFEALAQIDKNIVDQIAAGRRPKARPKGSAKKSSNMKVVKPMKLALFHRVVEVRRRPYFHVGAMLGSPLADGGATVEHLALETPLNVPRSIPVRTPPLGGGSADRAWLRVHTSPTARRARVHSGAA